MGQWKGLRGMATDIASPRASGGLGATDRRDAWWAPALATAQVGIAVAGASDITAEAADVVYMPRSLERLPLVFEVARRAVSTKRS